MFNTGRIIEKEMLQIGPFKIRIMPRYNARNITLRVDPRNNGFVVTVPVGIPRQNVLSFLNDRNGWMQDHAERSLLDWQPTGAPGERHMLLGKRVTLGRDGVPSGASYFRWAGARTTEVVRQLLPKWETRMNVRTPVIKWRYMKTRWGSCNIKSGEIHLNSQLSHMPLKCIEYVLVHELCHLHHPDHSPAFHAEMTRLMPDWKERKEELNSFDMRPLPPL